MTRLPRLIKNLLWGCAAAALAGAVLVIAGVVGLDAEEAWGDPLFYAGLGVVAFALVAVLVCSAMRGIAERRVHAKMLGSLSEDEGLLFDTVVRFTARGMELPREGDVFAEETLCVPARSLRVCRVYEYASPKSRAREEHYLVFPVPAAEGDGEPVSAPLDERTERLALACGAEEAEKRFPAETGGKVGVFRFFGRTQRNWAIAFSVLFVLLLGAAVGFGVWFSVTIENFSAGTWSGVCCGAGVPLALACGSALRRDSVTLYEGGVYARFTARGRFYLPYGAIECISHGEGTVALGTGYGVYCLPECGGLYEALRERCPAGRGGEE